MKIDIAVKYRAGLSNLNQPRAAHSKSCLKVGHLKQNLQGFTDFSKNF